MSTPAHGSNRQRPPGTAGRTRDADRDRRILHASLDLLAEQGPDAVTMESVAARAGVGKSTVYRRWATLAHLMADALDTLAFPVDGDEPHPASLRDDLVDGLITASGCTDARQQRIVTAVMESSHRNPALTDGLRMRFARAVHNAVTGAVERAAARGEDDGHRGRARVSDRNAIEFVVVAGLIVHLPAANGRPLTDDDFGRIVDEALLPLLRR